jgi:cytochrome c biogenesis protein
LATSPQSKQKRQKPKPAAELNDALIRRPEDHVDSVPNEPAIGVVGWLRWSWRQVTSMRTAMVLLLLLAAAAVPGSLFPQRSADPNGVTIYFQENPSLAPVLDKFQLFDVYSSAWFSAIYILLFISLIGCVVPRIAVHSKALMKPPAATPKNMKRMPAYLFTKAGPKKRQKAIDAAAQLLKSKRYRVLREGDSVAAERGYWRETGNLVFHVALLGLLISVGIGGAYSFSGQRILVEGDTFVNNLAGYDSFNPGIAFNENQLPPFSLTLNSFSVKYYINKDYAANNGTPLSFDAAVTIRKAGQAKGKSQVIKVNEPAEVPGASIYLSGNGYAPVITVRDGEGKVAYSGPVIFLPQDANMTSLGVIKVPDAKPKQFGILAFFYPTAGRLQTGAFTSVFPANANPLVTMNIYQGNLGLDSGIPENVFTLAVHGLKQLTGGKTGTKSIELALGQSAKLPDGLGSVSFDSLRRYASLDVDYNPGQGWVLFFALTSVFGLILSLLIPRRRVWVKMVDDGFEVAALARGDDPALTQVVEEIAATLKPKKAQSVETDGATSAGESEKE